VICSHVSCAIKAKSGDLFPVIFKNVCHSKIHVVDKKFVMTK
jgi:hypothetical protein